MELIEVGIIVARDVAVATSIADSADVPKLWNKKNNTGTMTMPPPTPNKPAKMPAKTPVAANPIIVAGWLIINSMILINYLKISG